MIPASSLPVARRFWAVLAVGALVVLAGLYAAHVMETRGHIVTGMNNRIVWGLPHVFAIFLIVAASGVLNVASVGSVFRQQAYKPQAPLSGLLCLALLAGGLVVLMLDLGRPERIVVAATHYNFTSVFAWNMFLYSGMAAIVAVYLWTLMAPRRVDRSRAAGIAAFAWRIILTSGTGSIFAFLVARQAFGSAVLIPLFLAMSLAWGLAVFLVAQSALYRWHGLALPMELRHRLRNLLALFVVAVLFFVLVYHLTNGYFAKQAGFERFILRDGGVYPLLFWGGYVVAGSLMPLFLLWRPPSAGDGLVAPWLVIVGAFALLYVFIIGGQAYPQDLFPGLTISSTFADGVVQAYTPSAPEWALGVGGIGIAFLIALVGARVLDFLPDGAAATPQGAGAD
jgi:molybdopterin-containing oxidoreductase family membrane subunit